MKSKSEDKQNYSILDHVMVPGHEILSDDEVQDVLGRYDVDKSQLPKIKVDDPVCIEIGASVGDVVKVTRKSVTAGEAVVYRLVI